LTQAISSERIDIFLPGASSRRTLFLLGGRRPDARWLKDFASRNADDVWAVDSGVGACREAGLCPGVLIGDMDSATQSDIEWAIESGASEFRSPRDKDDTDFQLALELLAKKNRDDTLLVSGCFGGRLDHMFSALYSFASSRSLCMADETEGVLLVHDSARAVFKKRPLAISLLPLSDECAGVSIVGVKWPLDGATLYRNRPWAVSNETDSDEVLVSCASGLLGFYWVF
jgi:thiamine pyrophosphokinase